MKRAIIVASAAALLLSLTACATGGSMAEPSSSPSLATPAPIVPPSATPLPSMAPTGDPIAVPDASWAAIKADLAQRGVTGEPKLVSSESVVWNDGSLGCAKPGQNYTMATVEGMRIVVSVDGTQYDYRFGANPDAATLCQA